LATEVLISGLGIHTNYTCILQDRTLVDFLDKKKRKFFNMWPQLV